MKTLRVFTELWLKRRTRLPGPMVISLILPLGVLIAFGIWGDRQTLGTTMLKIVGFMTIMDGLAALVTIAEAREQATLRFFQTTRLNRGIFGLGFILHQVLFSLATGVLFAVVVMLFFGVRFDGNLLFALLFIALGSFTLTSTGLAIATGLPSNFGIAFAVWPIILVPFILFSGIFFQLSGILLNIAYVFPTYHLMAGLQTATLGIVEAGDTLVNLVVLAVWGCVSFFIVARAFRWN